MYSQECTMTPRKTVPMETVIDLLRQGFVRAEVATMLGVSLDTIKRRMSEAKVTVTSTYSNITDRELENEVTSVLENHPQTGAKVMNGFLMAAGIKVKRDRLRQVIAKVDPVGVECRKSNTRLIYRRKYEVTYSQELWHIDTHLKLVRWKFVIKGCVDGLSRTNIFLDVASNNTSDSMLGSFIRGVGDYGVPIRTRSDKGLENRGVAEFMLRNRGCDRGSHICGRSVHNQRIERFWVDVYAKVVIQYYALFSTMENRGLLQIQNELHMSVLHHVFLPRIQFHLQSFRNGWNNHSLSTSRNKTPNQLMLLHLPPADRDLCLKREFLDNSLFTCNSLTDAAQFNEGTLLTQPSPPRFAFSAAQSMSLNSVDVCRPSESYGLDVYMQCLDVVGSVLLMA